MRPYEKIVYQCKKWKLARMLRGMWKSQQVSRMSYLVVFILSFFHLQAQSVRTNDEPVNYHFKKGEQLDFKLSYGWFTVGKAEVTIDDRFHKYKSESCYKIEVTGETSGLLGVFTQVDDSWGAYITPDLRPLHSYRNIKEGGYHRVERNDFDYANGKVDVLRYDPRKEKRRPIRTYEINENVRDLLSSYLYLRNVDFGKYAKGDTIALETFYDEEFYHFKLLFDGIEKVNTRVGELQAYKTYFLMPTNDIFPEEKGIVAWISADPNHLPLKIEAEMFFGKAYCELTSYRNLKYGPDYQ